MTLIDVGGNLGGLVELLSLLLCYFVEPIAVHAFTLKAISTIYTLKKHKEY